MKRFKSAGFFQGLGRFIHGPPWIKIFFVKNFSSKEAVK